MEQSVLYKAPSADVVGDVKCGNEVSIWYQAVVRTEVEPIRIGAGSNIQDCCVLHTDAGFPIYVGRDVTVGHGAILHGCIIGDNSLIGMGAIVLNGAEIGDNCIIGAGALVTGGTKIPAGHLAFGNPAKVVRPLTEEEINSNAHSAEHYRIHGREAFGEPKPTEFLQENASKPVIEAGENPVERAKALLQECKKKQQEAVGVTLTYKLQLHDDTERVAKLIKLMEAGKAKPKHKEALEQAMLRLETSMVHIFKED